MKTKTFIIAVLLLAVALPARAHQLGGTPYLIDDCGCGCQSKKNEQVAVGSEEAQLNRQINALIDSVEGKLDLPENAAIAAQVEQLIKDRNRLAEKRRKFETQYTKCLARQND